MISKIIAGIPVQQTFTYEEFVKKIEAEQSTSSSFLSDEEKKLREYAKLNLQRMKRVDKTYEVSDKLKQQLLTIQKSLQWTVITEGWCGDSAQNLPAIAKIAKTNPLINLQIIERDKNLEIMDRYLTNGTRSIPILVGSDSSDKEIFKWGPRPKEAQQLVTKLKSEGMEHDAFVEQLHLWYAKNKSKSLEEEFVNLLKNI